MNLPTLHYHKFESQIEKFNKIEDSVKRSVIKRQTSQIANDYKWLRVTTSDYNWLRARLQVPSSNYNWLRVIMKDYQWLRAGLRLTTSHFKWLRVTTTRQRVTTSDYQSNYEWLQLGLARTLGIKTFIVSYDYTIMNEVNTLKIVSKIVVLRFWWKSLKNTCDAETVLRRCSSK